MSDNDSIADEQNTEHHEYDDYANPYRYVNGGDCQIGNSQCSIEVLSSSDDGQESRDEEQYQVAQHLHDKRGHTQGLESLIVRKKDAPEAFEKMRQDTREAMAKMRAAMPTREELILKKQQKIRIQTAAHARKFRLKHQSKRIKAVSISDPDT